MTTVADKFDARLVQDACNEAGIQARTASKAFYDRHGDRDACGFAWVNIWGVRSNSRLGKTLQTFGFRKSYDGSLQLWNPAVPLPKASQSWKQALKPTPRSSQNGWASRPTQVAD